MKDDESPMPAIDAATTHVREGAGTPSEQTPQSESVRRPYRGVPRNFVEIWPKVGWGAGEAEFGAHARTISRWLDECGRDEMILARKRYLDAQRTIAGRARRKRYVMGRTLNAVDPSPQK